MELSSPNREKSALFETHEGHFVSLRVLVVYHEAILSFVNLSFTVRHIPRGFVFFSSSGNNSSGQFWYASGLAKRRMPSAPTEVNLESEVAGKGPPCCILRQTSTPVGTPFNIKRPQIFFTFSTSSSWERISFSVAINVAVNCPSSLSTTSSISASFLQRITMEYG